MAGCLDNFQMPSLLENLNITERRNKLSSILAGLLFFLGWWIAIDAAVCYHDDMLNIFHICGVFGSLSMFMVTGVSNGQLRGDSYTTGCIGMRGARVWFFIGFLMGFGALIGASWILFGEYLVRSEKNTFHPKTTYPGFAIFFQNALIFFSCVIYKFGRSEELWG
ncbi:transmembrane protein 50B-like [Tigriopus californicus]|uniref:transmembrane protein 50B-like n=1 Tax=Tigriopus californicus TaxID=6832 RepID=UPI0027DA40AA|nr:transmembrane protein 50B-like [Tigriopus californicus]